MRCFSSAFQEAAAEIQVLAPQPAATPQAPNPGQSAPLGRLAPAVQSSPAMQSTAPGQASPAMQLVPRVEPERDFIGDLPIAALDKVGGGRLDAEILVT